MRRFFSIFHARNMEFLRDRSTLFFNLFFPFFLIFGLAFAFSGNGGAQYKIGIIGQKPATGVFYSLPSIQFIPYDTESVAAERLRHHQIDLVIDFRSDTYVTNVASDKSRLAEKLFLAYQGTSAPNAAAGNGSFHRQALTGKSVRYVDWFVPGVIGMNLGFLALFGVGFVIVRYRKNGVLKRLKATPITPLQFVGAQAASRFLIVIVTSVIVFGGSDIFLHFLMLGSYWNLILITALAVVSMISLGLIFAARIRSEELAQGLMNLVLWPMMAFSGVFFSLAGSPRILQNISDIFPLTHFIRGARAIMLDGAGLAQIAPELLWLVGLTALFLAVATALFRWD